MTTQGGTYTDITPKELQAMLGRKDFTFVNVHIPFEGDIAQTDVSIPYNEIGSHLDKLPRYHRFPNRLRLCSWCF